MNMDRDLEKLLRSMDQGRIRRPEGLISQTIQRMRSVHSGKKGKSARIIGKNVQLVIATSFLLLFSFIATWIALPPLSGPTSPNPDPVILQGSNLADLGRRIDIEALEPLTYPSKPYLVKLNYFLVADVYGTYDPTMDVLAFDYPEELSIETVRALYVQGFKKSTEPDVEQFIEVASELYNIRELDEYKLFEDEDVLVFDITDLLFEEDFATRNNWVDQWGIDVYEYLRSHEDVAIIPLEGH
jgi:hypothetical protein